MKVSVEFNESGLRLLLVAENDAERLMVGAVLNQPTDDRNLDNSLLTAEIKSSSHFTYGKVDSLRLTVARREV